MSEPNGVDSVLLAPLADKPIKVRMTVGPVTIDTEAIADQIVLLVKRMVEEFKTAKIIGD